jgi:predicted DNA-binding transcriptional regulator AlpA
VLAIARYHASALSKPLRKTGSITNSNHAKLHPCNLICTHANIQREGTAMNASREKNDELDEIESARRAMIAEGAAQAARSIKNAEEAAAIAAASVAAAKQTATTAKNDSAAALHLLEEAARKSAPKAALSIAQFCEQYQISRSTYYTLQKQGFGPAELRIGPQDGAIRITQRACDEWEKEQSRQAANDDSDAASNGIASSRRRR